MTTGYNKKQIGSLVVGRDEGKGDRVASLVSKFFSLVRGFHLGIKRLFPIACVRTSRQPETILVANSYTSCHLPTTPKRSVL